MNMDREEQLHQVKYQIKDAIRYLGINQKTSGGWQDHIVDPIVDDIVDRLKIEQKIIDRDREIVRLTLVEVRDNLNDYWNNHGEKTKLEFAVDYLSKKIQELSNPSIQKKEDK